MRISTVDDEGRRSARDVPFVSRDRAAMVRLVVAIVLGLVAFVVPQVAPTAAEFTGNDTTDVTLRTSEVFDDVVAPPPDDAAPDAVADLPGRP